MSVPFAKMCGAGNDFIVIDNRDGILADPAEFARMHCRRRFDIGADGLMLVEDADEADIRIRVINADGSEAEMCGNGARCAAMFAYRKGIAPASMVMESIAGPVSAEVTGAEVTIGLDGASALKGPCELYLDGRTVTAHWIEVGVPHTIIFVDDAEDVDVVGLGRPVRYHEQFEPRGTNVNFVQIAGPSRIRVRTYERGVEDETLACGTGSSASSIISHLLKGIGDPPIEVVVNGGRLKVDFRMDGDAVRDLRLTGDAVTACEGLTGAQ